MRCSDCGDTIEETALPGVLLCRRCLSQWCDLADSDAAPLYDAVGDVLTEADLWE